MTSRCAAVTIQFPINHESTAEGLEGSGSIRRPAVVAFFRLIDLLKSEIKESNEISLHSMAEAQVQRDTEFYFAFRTFKVADAVFRVPRHLFLMPNAKIEPVPQENDTGDDLVELGEEIKKDDFLQLLRAVYPREYGNPETLNSAQWQAVLKLSKVFGMDDVCQKAARNLKDIFFAGDPVDALICARENKLDEWAAPLIEKIVQRKRELTEDEIEKIGTPLAIKIAWALGAAGAAMR